MALNLWMDNPYNVDTPLTLHLNWVFIYFYCPYLTAIVTSEFKVQVVISVFYSPQFEPLTKGLYWVRNQRGKTERSSLLLLKINVKLEIYHLADIPNQQIYLAGI